MAFFHNVWLLIKNMGFLWEFFALTGFYLLTGTLLALLKIMVGGSVGVSTHKVKAAWQLVAGTKAAWAFTFIAMTLVTLVIAIFNPGEPLLMNSSDWYAVKRKASYFLWGTIPELPPPAPPNPWGWFWWKSFVFYVFLTVIFVFRTLPDIVRTAWRAANTKLSEYHGSAQQGQSKAASPALLALIYAVTVAFIGSFIAELWAYRRRNR
ncbi:MAG: hypothetical protein QME81_08300 [bacterium]|nr:hypothetical protein [bacterium]